MSIDQSLTTGLSREPARSGNSLMPWLLSLFAAFHVALIFALPDAAERFMLGDRANDRTVKMENLLGADSFDAFLGVLFRQSQPGDYVLFAPAYWLGGPTAVMLQNTALILIGVLFLYRLARLFFSERVSVIAATAYCLLPATLFHPHAFVSEGICNPLLIVSAYFLARFATSDRPKTRDLIITGALTALLCFTRHIYLLLPLFFTAILWLTMRQNAMAKLRASAIVIMLGFSLVAGWSAAAHIGEQYYGAGESVGGLGSNLYLRAERMSRIGGFELPATIDERAKASGTDLLTLPPAEFSGLVAAHPLPFAKTIFSDAFNITANPGMAMVFGRFLRVFDLGEKSYEDYSKWRQIRDKEGLPALVMELWKTSPTGVIVNAGGAVAWLGFVLIALYGAWTLLIDRAQPLVIKLLLFGLPAYLIGFASIAAGYTRWDHRSPAEFAIALLFAVGVMALMELWNIRTAKQDS